jgi:Holliday junction resolvase RusA-like endonuclease
VSERIAIDVRGIPAPGGSKRGFLHKATGRVIVVDACRRSKDWKALVSHAAAEAYAGEPLVGPVALEVEFRMPRPKAHYTTRGLRATAPEHHTRVPDATKLLRSTEDALTGICWHDDAQVAVQVVRKVYHEQPGARIVVQRLCDLADGLLTCGGRR